MVNVRPHPEQPPARLSVLITRDRAYGGEHWTEQLPRLLEPQGVRSHIVNSGREAIDIAGREPFHAALIDLRTPVTPRSAQGGQAARSTEPADAGGVWILELFRRMPNPPATIIVQKPAFTSRQLVQRLESLLRLGAFSVVDEPVAIEQLLDIFRRLLERHYRGAWPGPPAAQSPDRPDGQHGPRGPRDTPLS